MNPNEDADFAACERLRVAVDERAPQSEVDHCVAALREELAHRAYRWTYIAGHAAVGMSIETATEPSVRLPSFFSITRYYVAGLSILAGAAGAAMFSLMTGVVIGVVGFGGVVAWQLQANQARRARLASCSCLQCRYDLCAVPLAVDPAAIGGMNLGPLRCPECGRMWPVIPLRDGSA